jgi:transcriptional regulator of arginine metabolism
MKNKHSRLSAIRVIIAGERIGSQDELLKRLTALGYECTQATLSRDLKELEVTKGVVPGGDCIYLLPDSPLRSQDGEQGNVQLSGAFVSIDFSANMAVMKTRPGYASGVASDIDRNALKSVLGTVAGHDTIILVVREGYTKSDVLTELERIVPEIKTLNKL